MHGSRAGGLYATKPFGGDFVQTYAAKRSGAQNVLTPLLLPFVWVSFPVASFYHPSPLPYPPTLPALSDFTTNHQTQAGSALTDQTLPDLTRPHQTHQTLRTRPKPPSQTLLDPARLPRPHQPEARYYKPTPGNTRSHQIHQIQARPRPKPEPTRPTRPKPDQTQASPKRDKL